MAVLPGGRKKVGQMEKVQKRGENFGEKTQLASYVSPSEGRKSYMAIGSSPDPATQKKKERSANETEREAG